MLSFVVFGFTCVVGLVVVLAFLYWGNSKEDNGDKKTKSYSVASKPLLKTEDIPGWNNPPADDNLGDTPVMGQHGSLHQYLLARHAKEGPIFAFWMPEGQHVVSISSPELFTHTTKLFDRPECLFELFRPLITSDSIQYANHEDGRNRRAQYDPAFQHKAIQEYFSVFVQCGEEFLNKFNQPERRQQVSLSEDCFTLTIQSMCRSSLGDVFADEEEVKTLSRAYHKCWNEMESRLAGDFPTEGDERRRQFEEEKKVIFDVVARIIEERRNSSDTSRDLPFIDSLLGAHLPEATSVADVVSYLIGGFHTSGYFMVWCLYYLGLHPEVQEKLYREVVQVWGGQEEITFAAVKKMKYLRQVQDEVLRLSTLASFAARFSDDDITVGEYPIPAKTPIVHALGVASMDEKVWGNPLEFDPERFSPESTSKRSPNAFVPFGFGRRICPGYIFAYIEVGAFLAMILRRYRVTILNENPVEKVYGFVTKPKEELMARFEPR